MGSGPIPKSRSQSPTRGECLLACNSPVTITQHTPTRTRPPSHGRLSATRQTTYDRANTTDYRDARKAKCNCRENSINSNRWNIFRSLVRRTPAECRINLGPHFGVLPGKLFPGSLGDLLNTEELFSVTRGLFETGRDCPRE